MKLLLYLKFFYIYEDMVVIIWFNVHIYMQLPITDADVMQFQMRFLIVKNFEYLWDYSSACLRISIPATPRAHRVKEQRKWNRLRGRIAELDRSW